MAPAAGGGLIHATPSTPERRAKPVIDRERWRVLEPLLDRALDLADEDRAVWLEALRMQSPAEAEEIVSLLSAERAADRRGFLGEPPHDVPSTVETSPDVHQRAALGEDSKSN